MAAGVYCVGALMLVTAALSGATTGTIQDMEHIVIFMQENRPFDHYYGTLQGVRGFNDRAAPELPNGRSPFYQPLKNSSNPYPLCGCSTCDFKWGTAGDASQIKSMLLSLSCAKIASATTVSIKDGETCSEMISELQKAKIEDMSISDAILTGSGCPASKTVNGASGGVGAEDDDLYMLPFPLDFKSTAATCMPAPEMDYPCDIKMWNNGNMDGWCTARDPGFGMAYFNRTELPYYYALADAFTIGDQYFQSTYTATCPNREHLFSGSNGLSAANSSLNLLDDSEPAGMTWETMGETLEKAGISWQLFQGADNFDDNGFAWFENYKNAKPGEALYDKGMSRQDDFVQSFADTVANGSLPQVTWLVGPAWLSEHANNHPADGEDLSSRLIAVLQANPEVYMKTGFIINYDEGGQFYDHHWTPNPPTDGNGKSTVSTKGELLEVPFQGVPVGQPIGLGFRVPFLIVSPWTRGNLVFSEVSDHTSTLQLIEKRFGVRCPNISPWRRAITSDLTAAFDFSNPDYSWPASFPSTAGNTNASKQQCDGNPPPVIPKVQSMPVQETGVKQQRALGYEFQISDSVSGTNVTISMINSGTSGVVFYVYDRVTYNTGPRRYTIEPGKNLSDTWSFAAASKYQLNLHGPNGFVRKFSGSSSQTSHAAALSYDKSGQNVRISIAAGSAANFSVRDNAYGVDLIAQVPMSIGHSTVVTHSTREHGNWYDISVVDPDSSFERRFMGRMETGRTTTSDPAMGAARVLEQNHPELPEYWRDIDPVVNEKLCTTRRSQMKDTCWKYKPKDEL